MFTKKIKICLFPAVVFIFLSISINIYYAEGSDKKFSSSIPYKPIEISALSRYTEDRIAFQHIQLPGFYKEEDNSVASLLIIKNNEVILFRDGYDDAKKVSLDYYMSTISNELPKDFWPNKINSKPDYIRIASRRAEILFNTKEEYIEKNSGDIYRSVRNSFLNYHVKIFKKLMINRTDSDFNMQRDTIFPPAFQELNYPVKFATVIKARALNDYLYYAEDKNGDDITETFTVTMSDSFNWGYKSGPNIIFIYNNKEEDIKQIIGKMCYEAYAGTPEEEANLSKKIPTDTEILNAFNIEKVKMQPSQPGK